MLLSAAERGGIVMMARIAVVRALNHGAPEPPSPKSRRKPAKRYKVIQ
jgi:hypothetical protein